MLKVTWTQFWPQHPTAPGLCGLAETPSFPELL